MGRGREPPRPPDRGEGGEATLSVAVESAGRPESAARYYLRLLGHGGQGGAAAPAMAGLNIAQGAGARADHH
jgi:hypothetical protein